MRPEPLYSQRQHTMATSRPSMTDPTPPDYRETVAHAAADWFARVRAGTLTRSQQAEFEQWRQADAAHEQAYAEMQAIWQSAAQFDPVRLRRSLAAPRPIAVTRRRLAASLALGAAIAAGVAWNLRATEPILQEQMVTTRVGERRQVLLSDGTSLEINTATRARVRLYADRREVELQTGEIMFAVTPDPQRPFLVDAGRTQVRVTGTRFDVRRDGEHTAVAVESGSVAITAGSWWQRRQVHLTAGQGVRQEPGTGFSGVETLDLRAATAWRQGKIVFADTPLSRVVSEMNRYLTQPIVLADSRLARLRVAGLFSVDDPDAFLDALPTLAPVEVLRGADGAVMLRSR